MTPTCRLRSIALLLLIVLIGIPSGTAITAQSEPTLTPPPPSPTEALPTVDLPADPTIVFDGTLPVFDPTSVPDDLVTPTSVVYGDGFYRLALRFLPLEPGAAPDTLGGEMCARPVAEPGLAEGDLASHCTTAAEATFNYYPSATNPFPRESIYRVLVESNSSGCVTITDSYREYFDDGLPVAEVFVLIDCEIDVVPFPSAVSTEIAAVPAYSAVHVRVRDASGAYRYYDAPLCFQATLLPAASVTGNGQVCVHYAGTTGVSLTLTPGPDALLTSTVYAADITRNETGCAVAQSFSAEGNVGYVTLTTTCTDPATYDSVSLHIYDEAGEETVGMGGELCVAVEVAPALMRGERIGELCATEIEAGETWLPGGDGFPTSSTYTARVTRNGTLCAAGEPDRGLERDGTGVHLSISVPMDCSSISLHTPTPFPVDPGDYSQVLVLFTEGDTVRREYPGVLCVDVTVNPPLPSGAWVGTMCEGHSPETTIWYSGPYVSLPIASTYRVTVKSNTTSCEVRPDPMVNEVVDGFTLGRIVVWLTCDDAIPTATTTVVPSETPIPPTTGIVTPDDPSTTVPSESPRSPTVPGASPSEEVPGLTPTDTAHESSIPVSATTPPSAGVTTLPTTGTGAIGETMSAALLVVGGLLLSGALWSCRHRPR